MGDSNASTTTGMLDAILGYVENVNGLTSHILEDGKVVISQSIDSKKMTFNCNELEEVLDRVDADGKTFIQVNFRNGKKVLLTETLIGFKPTEMAGLDMTKIPRVVTTPDLLSVFEAIEESLGSDSMPDSELEVLKKVFFAILTGGESVGFHLDFERRWIARLSASKMRASA